MAQQQPDYRAYLMRLWRDDQTSGWRGSLENPHTGDREHFATVAQLIETIVDQTSRQGDSNESDRNCVDPQSPNQ